MAVLTKVRVAIFLLCASLGDSSPNSLPTRPAFPLSPALG